VERLRSEERQTWDCEARGGGAELAALLAAGTRTCMSMDSERSDQRPAEFDDPGGEGRRSLQPARADVVDSARSGVSGSACVSSVTEALGDNLLMVDGVLTVPTAWQSSPQKPAVPDNCGRGACSCLTREM